MEVKFLPSHVCNTRVSYRIFYWGGGGIFLNSKIDIKHTFLGGSGGMPPQKMFA